MPFKIPGKAAQKEEGMAHTASAVKTLTQNSAAGPACLLKLVVELGVKKTLGVVKS